MDGADLGIDGLAMVEMIGRGGFGAVYRVRDEAHGRDVAVKLLPALLDDSARRQFDRERRAMGALADHPGIGTVHTSGFTANGEPGSDTIFSLAMCSRCELLASDPDPQGCGGATRSPRPTVTGSGSSFNATQVVLPDPSSTR